MKRKIILNIDDLMTIETVAEHLGMVKQSVKRMRDSSERKYKLLVLGLYFENEALDVLVITLDTVNRITRSIAVDELLKEGIVD